MSDVNTTLETRLKMEASEWKNLESKWQNSWREKKTHEANPDSSRKKFFINFPYPYMNGRLHLGHAYSNVRCDVLARYKRLQGYNVLYPQGWHCTGTPIIAAARRIAEGEPSQIKVLEEMGINANDISKFSDPMHWIRTFPIFAKEDLTALGISVDWRRSFITTEINPVYDKFVHWQFEKLRNANYITKGNHPVVWCPKDNAPVGDHDRTEGEGIVPQEFTLLKFKFGDYNLIAATLRPETVYGQTNLWANPSVKYAVVNVNDEKWIVSQECAEKLKLQKANVTLESFIDGKELIGKQATAPGIERTIPILPATFCDPKVGSGIVTSVPSDAPYDYIALLDLQKNEEICKQFGLNFDDIKKITPIPIIRGSNGDEFLAIMAVAKYGIKDQSDPRLEEATKEVYKEGFYQGTTNKNCGKYSNKPVQIAKEEMKTDLLLAGKADIFHELAGNVICRCLTPSTVKIVSDQWFLAYGNKDWKDSAKKALAKLNLYPETVRAQFENTIDWLRDWACTREHGTGTRLPWDNKWIIESLSDSTIYMAYYTISKFLEHPAEYGIDIKKLNSNFFDYVFLGKGDAAELAEKFSVAEKLLTQIKSEFEYWYPFDFRGSGKDLIQNHLSFCLFNHAAIFPEKYWPGGFGTNGWLMVNGEKMSKSKGNFFTIQQMLEKYPADVIRTTLMYGGEGLDDPNFEFANAGTLQKKLFAWHNFALEHYGRGLDSYEPIDSWFESVLNKGIKTTTDAFEQTAFKTALASGFFELQQNLRKYLHRKGTPNKTLLSKAIEIQTQMLAPFAPHLCEEIWQNIGKAELLPSWPAYNSDAINEKIETQETAFENTIGDIKHVMKFARKRNPNANQLHLYVVPEDAEMYISSRDFLGKELGVKVSIYRTDDSAKYDPRNKSLKASVGKPGIYIE